MSRRLNNSKRENNKTSRNQNKAYVDNTKKEKFLKENDEFSKMNNTINELEEFNAKKILKGDLYEMYEELIRDNLGFKDDVFFVNLNYHYYEYFYYLLKYYYIVFPLTYFQK